MELDHVTLLRLGTFERRHDGTKYGEEYDSIQRRWHARAHTHAHTTFFLDKWKLPFSNKRKRQARSTGCSAPLACCSCYTRKGDQCNPTPSVEFAETGRNTGEGDKKRLKDPVHKKERGNGMALQSTSAGKQPKRCPPLENPVARIRLVLLDR
ncbi:uncharacterized protein B0T23DRAFT_403256 [Neurospora hispaniola]|uniref:Uncharacterized protein n=1 Tax=Neurospora hispaniola TaxID=588809 RepID=A0AAJ0I928_9PEZI|nr:hypothetical protein B0T23DRAFT_403256 [Neurospora hispaniola]